MSSAGDVNGDGYDDILIGADRAEPIGGGADAGKTYLVYGTAAGLPPTFDLSPMNGTNGFVMTGVDRGDYSGRSVSDAGDITGDGFDDILIGTPIAGPNGTGTGGRICCVRSGIRIACPLGFGDP